MRFVFPYQYEQVGNLTIPYPLVPITLTTIRGPRNYLFLVDTGADILTLPNHMIYLLGIKRQSLKQNWSQGIGNKLVKTWGSHINIVFCNKNHLLPCIFTDNDHTPMLLGKSGIFDKYNIAFDNKNHQTIFDRHS